MNPLKVLGICVEGVLFHPLQFGKIFLVSDLKWHSDMRYMNKLMHLNSPVHVVSSMLNSATGTPLAANIGANPAAGYTTDDVPT